MGNLIFNNSLKFSFFNCVLDTSKNVGDSYISLSLRPPLDVKTFKALFSKFLKNKFFPFNF